MRPSAEHPPCRRWCASSNRHGTALVRALVTDRQRRGHLFVPMHWTDQFASNGRVDALVTAKVDPVSGQPALKMAEVSVEAAMAKCYGFAVSRSRPDFTGVEYWALAVAKGGVRTELAWLAPPADWDAWVRHAFKVAPDTAFSSMHDKRSGHHRFALFEDGELVFALYLAPEPVAVSRHWAASLLESDFRSSTRRSEVLAGGPSADMPDGGAIVCSCFSVGINTIASAIRDQGCTTVEMVGAMTSAGTNCGSCRAEIGGIINANRHVAA